MSDCEKRWYRDRAAEDPYRYQRVNGGWRERSPHDAEQLRERDRRRIPSWEQFERSK